MNRERFEGCLLGLALGDALGAPFEGGPIERFVWRVIGKTRSGETRWTDDTQMSLDVAESLVSRRAVDPDDLARRFAASYRWSRGYGPGTAKLLRRIARGADWREANRSVYSNGSFGNGAAMRAPMVGLFWSARPHELVEAARGSACVTHSHPLGIEGAVMIAAATAEAVAGKSALRILEAAVAHCETAPFIERLDIVRAWLGSDQASVPREVSKRLGHGIAAAESCVTALYVALRFLPRTFGEMHEFVVACRGDVDTIGAMAGAIWGAANGVSSLPSIPLRRLEQRDRLLAVARALHDACAGVSGSSR